MAETVDLKNSMVNSSKPVDRMRKFELRWNMYNDNFKSQVTTRLREIYSKADLIGLDKQLDLTNNIYKTIIDKTSRVYSFGIERNLNDNLLSIYKKARVNKHMKQANKYVNAFNDVLMQVAWDSAKQIPSFKFRLPHRTKVKTDDDGNVIEVEYFIEHVKDKGEKWAFWSESQHYYKLYDKSNFTIEAIEGNEQMLNPYKVLPFVVMQNGFRDGYFFDEYKGDDMVNITLDNAIYNTFKNYLIKWQSFKQLVVTGAGINGISGQMLDPSSALSVSGTDVKIDLLDLQTNLEQLVNTLESSSNAVAINYNISPSQFRLSGQVSSGFALKMENKALDEFTKEQQEDFRFYEYELLKLIKIVGDTNGANIVVNEDLSIKFGEIKYSESTNDTLDAYTKSIELAITNPIEVIKEIHKVDDEEAEKMYNYNIEQRNKLNEKINTPALNINNTAEALGINA